MPDASNATQTKIKFNMAPRAPLPYNVYYKLFNAAKNLDDAVQDAFEKACKEARSKNKEPPIRVSIRNKLLSSMLQEESQGIKDAVLDECARLAEASTAVEEGTQETERLAIMHRHQK